MTRIAIACGVLSRSGYAARAPGLRKPPVLSNLTMRALEVGAVAAGDDDVAVWADHDGGSLVERVGAVTGHAGHTEDHQDPVLQT
jgi:hypothetical protein